MTSSYLGSAECLYFGPSDTTVGEEEQKKRFPCIWPMTSTEVVMDGSSPSVNLLGDSTSVFPKDAGPKRDMGDTKGGGVSHGQKSSLCVVSKMPMSFHVKSERKLL